mmetsp:Transcript_7994/g.18236  ORF Transcript_7994/g.18236 Transcript_7994/m.18236 type:complete len:201 (+) Transcript_7994:316-918(+)
MIVRSDLTETQDLSRDGSMEGGKVEDRSVMSIGWTSIWVAEDSDEFARSQERSTSRRHRVRPVVQEEFMRQAESVPGTKSLKRDSRIVILPATATRTTNQVGSATENRETTTTKRRARDDGEAEEKIRTAIKTSRHCLTKVDRSTTGCSYSPVVGCCSSQIRFVLKDFFYMFASINFERVDLRILVTYKGNYPVRHMLIA